MKPIYPTLTVAGALIGGVIGIITRPSFMGVQIPMEVISSSARADAPFKAELTSHLILTLGVGLVLGVVIAFILSSVVKNNKAT